MNVSPSSQFEDARALYGAAPISESAPAGEDVRGEPDFEELEAEVRRMDADGPGAVDWSKVGSASLRILSTRSKDILVASWATFALFRTEGYGGLAVGLGTLRGMVDAHWEGLFPPPRRERARVAAVDWLVGRVVPGISAAPPSETDYPAVLAAYDALTELDQLLGQKLQKEQVAAGDLFRALRPHREDAKRAIDAAAERQAEAARAAERAAAEAAAAPAPTPEAPGAGVAPPAAAAAVAAVPVPSAGDDWASVADRLPDLLRNVATTLRTASIGNPRAYVFNRIGSWARFDALPPASGGQTAVFPPTDAIQALEALSAAGRHADALAAAEDMVWSAPFCIDVHRLADQALEQLGPQLEPARTAIRSAVAFLATRHPTILTLRFNDGRPFADEATLAWAAAYTGGAPPSRDPTDEMIGEANKLLNAGQVQDAFDSLARLLDGSDNGRTRFQRQIAQAAFCLDRGFVTTALPLLEHLDAVAVERGLAAWEPELALQAASLRHRALSHSDAQQSMDDQRRRATLEEIKARVARLDIGLAARLGRN